MKKNNKGFTVVELLASFALTMVIVVFLFEILIELKDLYYEAGLKTEVVHKQSILVDKIRRQLDTSELVAIDCSGDTCTFKFADISPVELTIDADGNIIKYDDDVIKFPEEVRFEEYSISTCSLANDKPDNDLGLMEGTNAKNCYITLKIVVTSPKMDKDYPIHIVYPYVYDPDFLTGDFTNEEDYTGAKTKYIYDGTENKQYTAEATGTYKIELLGATGGGSDNNRISGGAGAYTSGEIYLHKDDILYLNVGGAGSRKTGENSSNTNGGFNGGGNGTTADEGVTHSGGGGGATDVRFGGTSLNDRIMVAAGGSGAGNGVDADSGIPGGSLSASNSGTNGPKGATQTTGGKAGTNGATGTFGKGANATTLGSGAGGGYYGGAGGVANGKTGVPGTGGTSYISGMLGSNSITSASNNAHTNNSNHYSGKIFYDTHMYSGDRVPSEKNSEYFYSQMPTELQNAGDGYAIITYEGPNIPAEASGLSGSKTSYDLTDSTVWLDGYDNSGVGMHSYSETAWHNLVSNNHMNLTNAKWKADGLSLSATGTLTMNAGTAFTLSTVFSLNEYPSETKKLISGHFGLYITSNGSVGFSTGTTEILFDYKIKNLNVKEYLTVVGSGSNIKLYSNGKEVSSKTLNTSVASNVTISLPGTLNGTLNKIMIFDNEKSAEEVDSIYSEDVARLGPKNYDLPNASIDYEFASEDIYDIDKKTVSDMSGNENNGTINGTMTVTNNALVLDGNENYIEFKGKVNYRYSAFLIVDGLRSGSNPSLMGNSTFPDLYLNSNDNYNYSFKSQNVNSSFNKQFTESKKEYIMITYDGKKIDLYVDGKKVSSIETSTDPLSVDKGYIGKNFKGNLYKFTMYDRTLTSDEIKSLYEFYFSEFK